MKNHDGAFPDFKSAYQNQLFCRFWFWVYAFTKLGNKNLPDSVSISARDTLSPSEAMRDLLDMELKDMHVKLDMWVAFMNNEPTLEQSVDCKDFWEREGGCRHCRESRSDEWRALA